MLQIGSRLGEWMMPEESVFPVDWKMAVLGALVLIGLVVTITVAALEGLPWVTKAEMQNKVDILTNSETINANAASANNSAISATNSQVSTLVNSITHLTDLEGEDRERIEKLEHQRDSLKGQLRQRQYADKLNRQHYENELRAVEHARSVGL